MLCLAIDVLHDDISHLITCTYCYYNHDDYSSAFSVNYY